MLKYEKTPILRQKSTAKYNYNWIWKATQIFNSKLSFRLDSKTHDHQQDKPNM